MITDNKLRARILCATRIDGVQGLAHACSHWYEVDQEAALDLARALFLRGAIDRPEGVAGPFSGSFAGIANSGQVDEPTIHHATGHPVAILYASGKRRVVQADKRKINGVS